MTAKFSKFGDWEVEALPEDGARLSRLRFRGYDLLTTAPAAFRAPASNYGEYEIRPVYGYDDCFPTVDACRFPGRAWSVPDHGELCWLTWDMVAEGSRLTFLAQSENLPITFRRSIIFGDVSLKWSFEVTNSGNESVPFLHVMHPLMPLDEVAGIELPPFSNGFEEITRTATGLNDPAGVERFLLDQPRGAARMALLRGVREGRFGISYRNGLRLTVTFPAELFPTIGIWWNNLGYPDENGCRRNECAFEPVPGNTGSLAKSHQDGLCLSVGAEDRFSWEINWEIG